ncbi:hypothetical protein [Rhizobium sp. SSA_523]|uniref:hypothetical protein n=1 Tax=Rhizobium sp. SSA_523 TaxID=2952477 RepID=UPI00208FFB6A|nr:hypothetical protein [Rhizobium sp. SSA_523]MCO5734090.1 hypothetical protein [Rhizobium sp. SSA_523]WKC24728.1 hypothetical protein QTJ18_11925 [Rhizobium sp. SSA_523]
MMSSLRDRQRAHPLVEAFFNEVGEFSIKDAARRSGLDRYTIIHWRTGRVASPKLVEFDYLLKTLGYELCFKKMSELKSDTPAPQPRTEGKP